MLKRGYNTRLSAGTILAGACLDPIIPPSVLAILIATLAEISTASLLIAGIIPGLLLMCLFLVYVMYRLWRDPSLAPDVALDTETKSRTGAMLAILRIVPCAFVFFMVMGLIMFGAATPTEAAATGVFGAIVVAFVYGKLSLRMIAEALATAATVSALLLVIMCCAVMFSQLLTFTGATRAVAELVAHLDMPAVAMLFAMMALPFLLFMFLDQLALMLVLIPIYQPLLKLFAFDPIWFWTLFLIVATMGGLTPPFGYVLFALKSAAPDLPTTEIYRASWPFVWLIALGMVILVIFPDLVTFLPNLARPD
jgi:tripartite ATP-independent transporter DctM subunit